MILAIRLVGLCRAHRSTQNLNLIGDILIAEGAQMVVNGRDRAGWYL